MKNVLYIYGFGSSPTGRTANWLKENLPDAKVYSVAYDQTYPDVAVPYLCKMVKELKIDVVIGSSLGGWYAMHVASICSLPSVIINPVTDSTIVKVIEYVTNRDEEMMRRFAHYYSKHRLFESKDKWNGYHWDPEENGGYSYLIWSDSDEVIVRDNKELPEEFRKNFPHISVVKDGGHQLTSEEKTKYLVPAYEKLVNEIVPKLDDFYKKTYIIP